MGRRKITDDSKRKYPYSVSLTKGQRKDLEQKAKSHKDVSAFLVDKLKLKDLPVDDKPLT